MMALKLIFVICAVVLVYVLLHEPRCPKCGSRGKRLEHRKVSGGQIITICHNCGHRWSECSSNGV